MGSLAADAESDRIVSRDPLTGEVLGEVPVLGPEEVRAAVARARAAQAGWAALPPRERCRRVSQVKRLLIDQSDAICVAIAKETGKPRSEALWHEVLTLTHLTNYFCSHAAEILAPRAIPLSLVRHRASYVHHVPRGVVGVIAPWNFPLAIPFSTTVMALIAGNGVVIKPSDVTPLIALKAKSLFDEAGIPPDLLQVVTGRGPTGAALIDAGIDYLSFTGSTATGRTVAAACGARLIPVSLELGGKAAAIVCADADLPRTARAIVWGAFANHGQVCASVERVYVHEAAYDELVDRVVAETQALRLGEQSAGEYDLGAMTWDRQLAHVLALIEAAVASGATVRHGGRRTGRGLQLEPTVLTGVTQDMDVMRREAFGPVLPIMPVSDEEEAVRLANDSALGLLGYVFSRDVPKARRLAERIEAGTVIVNEALFSHGCPELPWGGVKTSGIGLARSDEALRDLCQLRHVNYDRLALPRELWWFPYREKVYRQVLTTMRWLFR